MTVRLGGRGRALLRIGAVTIVLSMVLALWWALGEATGLAHPSLSWMAATHGVANAIGFVLCTLLGLRLVEPPIEPTGLTYDEVGATREGSAAGGVPRTCGCATCSRRSGRPGDVAAVGGALLRWQVHAAAGGRPGGTTPTRPPSGCASSAGRGWGRCTCRNPARSCGSTGTPERTGFGYGTLPGHLFRGEEAFTVERDEVGDLWFVATAYSVPDRWWVRLGGPLTRGGPAAVPAPAGAGRTAHARRAPAGRREPRVTVRGPRAIAGLCGRCLVVLTVVNLVALVGAYVVLDPDTAVTGGTTAYLAYFPAVVAVAAVLVAVVGFPAGLLTAEALKHSSREWLHILVFALVGAVLAVMLCAQLAAVGTGVGLALVAAEGAVGAGGARWWTGKAHAARCGGRTSREQRSHGEG